MSTRQSVSAPLDPFEPPELHLLSGGADGRALRAAARALCHSRPGSTHSSRSYRGGYGVVALGTSRVGVDLERRDAVAVPGEPGAAVRTFLDAVATPAELRDAAGSGWDPVAAASLWSSKEALAKALGAPLLYDPRRLDAPATWPEEPTGALRVAGRWRALPLARALALPDRLLGWVVWEGVPGGIRQGAITRADGSREPAAGAGGRGSDSEQKRPDLREPAL